MTPETDHHTHAPQHDAAVATGPHDGMRILVVDDSQTMRLTLSFILEKEYPVAQAADGQEGIELFGSFQPDVVLLDINMPRVDGFGVIEHIRQTVGDQDTFIIMLTAAEGASLKPKALNLGANDFLYKPFDRVELMARIGVARRQVQLTRKLRDYLRRTTQEIDHMASLQSRLLPHTTPVIPGVDIRSMYRPSGLASGDYYDFFPLTDDQSGPTRRLRIVVADVSGHGARAAFIMAIVRTLFRSVRHGNHSLDTLLQLVNSHLVEIVGTETDFVTLFAADLDFQAETITYVNAGHCAGLLRCGDGPVRTLAPTVPLLGFFDIDPVPQQKPMTSPADLLLYTDGFYEWEREPGILVDPDDFIGLAAEVMKATPREADDFLDRLMAGLRELTSGEPRFRDDVTALWVQTGKGDD